VKPVREGERRSRRKLGLAPEFKAEDLPVRTRRPRVLVQAFEPVPVVQTPEPIVSSSTSAELTAGVDNEKSLTTGETTTGFCKSCGSSGRVAQRGWTRWCVRAALAVGNMIVNDGHVFF
jgi:hypothetical protein